MKFLRVRKVAIDAIPHGMPFISVEVELVMYDEENDKEIQVIGNYDRIYRKLSDIGSLPIGNIADDGVVSATEIYTLIAQTTYSWLIEKHGGSMVGERLVIP